MDEEGSTDGGVRGDACAAACRSRCTRWTWQGRQWWWGWRGSCSTSMTCNRCVRGAQSWCSGTVHDARAGVHVGQQTCVGLTVCACGVLMRVFVRRVCECVSGGADSGGVFRPERGVAGEEVCVQVPPAEHEWGRLCVAGELAGVPPSVRCACLSVCGSN